ncbi:hypothetical protein N9948_00600 [bacterium]|nr:hypothetical protein [bacterium]
MHEITAKEVKKELKRIAFFVQHSGLFDGFSPQTRKTLESLPVEWESVQVDGETELKWQDKPHWKFADLEGKLNDKTIKMNIKKSSSRNTYTILYEGKKYTVESMAALKTMFDDMDTGKMPKPQMLQSSYDVLNKKKTNLSSQSKQYYLTQASTRPWKLDINKDSSRIFVKFMVPVQDEKEKNQVDGKLEEQGKFRINSVGTYIKKLLKQAGLDTNELTFTQRLLSVPNKSGFLITIK